MTDSIKLLLENAAVPASFCSNGTQGKVISVSWAELIDPKPKEEKSAGEIVEVVQKGGLVPVFKRDK